MKAFEDVLYETWRDNVEHSIPVLLKKNLIVKPSERVGGDSHDDDDKSKFNFKLNKHKNYNLKIKEKKQDINNKVIKISKNLHYIIFDY